MDQYLYIPFLGGWTSINPSYFDVNYRGTRVLTHCHVIPFHSISEFSKALRQPKFTPACLFFGSSKVGSSNLHWHCITVSWHVKNTEKHVFKGAAVDVFSWREALGNLDLDAVNIWNLAAWWFAIRQVRAALHCARDMFERRGSDMDSNGLACQLGQIKVAGCYCKIFEGIVWDWYYLIYIVID